MKKTAVFLALLLTLGITGCGAQKDTGSDSAEETTKEAQGETQEGYRCPDRGRGV